MKKKIFFTFLTVFFTGCLAVPKTEFAKITKPNDIITEMKEKNPLVFENEKWWTVYKDTSLNSLINLVLSENKDLKIAELNTEKSLEAVNLAEAQGGLHIDFEGNFKRERETENGTVPKILVKKLFNISTLGLQAGYNVDIFNKFKNLSQEQKYRAEGVKINSKWIELSISDKTAKLYVYWKYLQEEEKNLEEQKEILSEIKNLTGKSIKIGTGTEENLRNAENNIRLLNSLIDENKMNQHITLNTLNLLAGNSHMEDIKNILAENKNSMENIFKDKVKIPEKINSDIITERPDIKYYLMMIEAQKEHLKAAEADFYPQFSINGSYGFEAVNFNNLIKKGSLLGFIGPSIYLPIFHEGSIRSNYKIAGMNVNIFIEEYNKAVINAYNDIDNELYKTKTLKKSLENSEKNLLNNRKTLDENKTKLNIGTVSKYDYLLKKYNFTNSSLEDKQTHFKFYVQQINLINSIGGAYKE